MASHPAWCEERHREWNRLLGEAEAAGVDVDGLSARIDNAVWVGREAEDIMFGDFRIDHPEGGPIDFWLWDDKPWYAP